MEFGLDDLTPIVRLLPEMAGRFLWLTPAGSGSLKPPRRSARAERPAASAELIDGFTSAAMEILGQRRLGATVAFSGGADALDFARYGRLMNRYCRWIGYLGKRHQLDPGPAVCELPDALVFGLGFLCRRHCRGLALHLKAEQIGQGVELARRIVSNLEEKGPMNRRQLVRCFGNQRWERFEPAVGVLIKLGVLVWGEGDLLESGEAEISEVEDLLREALLAPPPADAGVPQAAKPKPSAQTPPEPRAGNGKKPAGKSPGKSK